LKDHSEIAVVFLSGPGYDMGIEHTDDIIDDVEHALKY